MLLREIDKTRLINIFSSIGLPIEVWAFGSRVDGSAHEGSDLDLVIRTHNLEILPNHIFQQVKLLIQESNIPIIVEVFDWARLPERFKENIEAGYEILFNSFAAVNNE